jgi:hypothetical protein
MLDPKAANTQVEYVIFIAFARQEFARMRLSVTFYVQSIACLVKALVEYCQTICVRVLCSPRVS